MSDTATSITCQSEFDREYSLSSPACDVRLTDDDVQEATTRSMPPLSHHDTCTEGPHRRAKRPRVSPTDVHVHDATHEDRSSNEASQKKSHRIGGNRVDTYTRVVADLPVVSGAKLDDDDDDDGRRGSTFTFGFSVP